MEVRLSACYVLKLLYDIMKEKYKYLKKIVGEGEL